MSSYLAEILHCVDKVEMEQLKANYSEVESSVEKCKRELLSYLEDIYVRFNDRPRENKNLANKIKSLQDDISGLIDNAKNVVNRDLSSTENGIEQLSVSLQHVDIAQNLVSTVYSIHVLLLQIKSLQEERSYLHCMQKIKEAEDIFASLKQEENLPVVQQLNLALVPEKRLLLETLSNEFESKVVLQSGDNQSVVIIKKDDEKLQAVLSALYLDQTSVAPLDDLAKFLWNNIFVPIVDCTTEVKSNLEDDCATLKIITLDPNKKASYAEVFANIKTVLVFLSSNIKLSLNEQLSALSYIGDHIGVNLSELIIKRCLEDTIPSTSEGLLQYQVVIDATQDLEKALIEANIFEPGTTPISEYANNIDVLFINKKCQSYVITARTLMEKDLHDVIEVGEDKNMDSLEESRGFPRCSVSRSVQDILQLLEKILAQAATSSDICAGRLFTTAKTICQTYVNFVPEHHKKLLQTIPQQIALFFNNCMYISYNLTVWNNTHLQLLSNAINFGDESFQLHQVASQMFNSYVQSQIEQIEGIMKDSGLKKQTLDQVEASTDKCLRQCLRQQELLKTVWNKVLPYSVYNKTLGRILDSLCNQLIVAIIKFEDISSEAAEQLVELFKIVQTRGPKLFTDPKEINLFVSNWYKLNELGFILGASLVDINDRWADGKGPLALQFKPVELKQLVRALFQNTEMRAALLAKILR